MTIERIRFVAVSEILGGGELHLLHTAAATAGQVPVAVVGVRGTPVLAAAEDMGIPVVELALGRKLSKRSAAPNLLRYPVARQRLGAFIARATRGEWTLLQYKWEQLLWGGGIRPDRVAIWEHGPIPQQLLRIPWSRRRLRHAFGDAGAVFAWSAPARDAIVSITGRDPTMLRAGVDPAPVQAAVAQRARLRERYASSGPLLVFAGRLARDKGVAELIQALPGMPGATAVVCGDGPERVPLEKLAAHLRVLDRTHFLGFVEDPLPHLAAADAALLLSTSPGEGRPLTVVEASAVGTPVLGLAGAPALEALAEEGLVALVPNADPESISAGVERLLSKPRKQFETPTWDDAAARFLAALTGSGQ